MNKIGTTSSGTVIVEMTRDEFEALKKIQGASLPAKEPTKVEKPSTQPMKHAERVVFVMERLKKLRPNTKTAAVHSIQTMFQFNGGIETGEIDKVLAALVKRSFIAMAPNGKVTYL